METISKSKLKKVPVIYKGKTLMPTTQGRAYHLMKLGKAMFIKDKYLGWYLKLKVKPKKIYKQKIALGIDTSWYDEPIEVNVSISRKSKVIDNIINNQESGYPSDTVDKNFNELI